MFSFLRKKATSQELPVDKAASASAKIDAWRTAHPDAEMRVVFGGHWSNNPGWLVLDEAEQDIGKTLDFPDNSIDVIFTEHVLEHVDFVPAANFLKESLRVLKPGGTCRIVCPMLDSVLSADLSQPSGETYIQNSLVPHFGKEQALLNDLGLDGLKASPFDFFVNSMFREHGHRFIWSSELLIRVMRSLGYENPAKVAVGEGSNPEYCIERRRRGIYLGYDWREEMNSAETFDLESTVVEARKRNE